MDLKDAFASPDAKKSREATRKDEARGGSQATEEEPQDANDEWQGQGWGSRKQRMRHVARTRACPCHVGGTSGHVPTTSRPLSPHMDACIVVTNACSWRGGGGGASSTGSSTGHGVCGLWGPSNPLLEPSTIKNETLAFPLAAPSREPTKISPAFPTCRCPQR